MEATATATQHFGKASQCNGSKAEDAVRLQHADSPLLQLPPEIRNIIWRYLLGNRMIHISCPVGSRRNFCYRVCGAQLDESTVETRFFGVDRGSEGVSLQDPPFLSCIRHEVCYSILDSRENQAQQLEPEEKTSSGRDRNYSERRKLKHSEKRRTLHGLDIDVLQTCRAIHEEARPVLYSSNTFSFRTGGALFEFMGYRWVKWIRKLHLDVGLNMHDGRIEEDFKDDHWYALRAPSPSFQDESEHAWNLRKNWITAISPEIVRRLRRLRILHVSLRFEQCNRHRCRDCIRHGMVGQGEVWESADEETDKALVPYRENRLHFLTKFRALQKLKRITVTAHKSGRYDWGRTIEGEGLPITARWLKETVMDCNGRSHYLTELQEKLNDGEMLDDIESQLIAQQDRCARAEYESNVLRENYLAQQRKLKMLTHSFEAKYGTDDVLNAHSGTISWLEGQYESDDSDEWNTLDAIGDWSESETPSPDQPRDRHKDRRNR